MFRRFIRELLCRHHLWRFVRNIYGDEINFRNGARSEWECKSCGKTDTAKFLADPARQAELEAALADTKGGAR